MLENEPLISPIQVTPGIKFTFGDHLVSLVKHTMTDHDDKQEYAYQHIPLMIADIGLGQISFFIDDDDFSGNDISTRPLNIDHLLRITITVKINLLKTIADDESKKIKLTLNIKDRVFTGISEFSDDDILYFHGWLNEEGKEEIIRFPQDKSLLSQIEMQID